MSEPRPVLAFAPPIVGSIPTQLPRVPPRPRGPGGASQGARLTPKFDALSAALAQGRAAASTSAPAAPDPELVVVLDVAGTVDGFVRAVRDIPGLEFLAEFDEDPVAADAEFAVPDRDGNDTDARVQETLYVVMTNATAVAEMVRLFALWRADPSVRFPKGQAPLKQAFELLRDLRRWSVQDRIRESGLLEQWQEELSVVGSSGTTRVEIELWFRATSDARTQAEQAVREIVARSGGTTRASAVVAEIDYHGLLAELPFSQVETVLEQGAEAIELLRADSIMFVAPAVPMAFPLAALSDEELDGSPPSSPTAPPVVGLLDGLPLANHEALVGRLIIDDPDDLASDYPARQRQHGTAMSSLICHGDLSQPDSPLDSLLYVRPVLRPHPWRDAEHVVDDQLLVDLIHRAFVRMFSGDGGQPAAAPSVRVVNLSLGDPVRAFTRHMSPLAKLLDWLSYHYNVLIIVSAGNHSSSFAVDRDILDDSPALQEALLKERFRQSVLRRLLSPAESINSLTVGATHDDHAAVPVSANVVDGLTSGLPALYGAGGGGHRRSVKPEILLPGGRELLQRPTDSTPTVDLVGAQHALTGPGLKVAAPAASGGTKGFAHTHGTSNSAAMASHSAARLFSVLAEGAATAADVSFPDAQYHPVLVKAMLVHAAEWGEAGEAVRAAINLEPAKQRSALATLLGYGVVDLSRTGTATSTRVVLLGAGSIQNKQRHSFSLPLPPSMAASTDWRRIALTLAWISPTNPRAWRHRQARLQAHPPDSIFGVTGQDVTKTDSRRGTVQHELLEGHRAMAFQAGDSVSVDVDCRIDGGADEPIRYGLAVTIELAASATADIHTEVRDAIRLAARSRAQIAPR